MEYDFFDLDNGLKFTSSKKIKKNNIKIKKITPKEYLSSITEKQLQKSYKFHEKINECHAKAISEAYNYVVF